MNSIAVLSVILAVVCATQAGLDMKKAAELFKKCQAETGAPEDIGELMKTHALPTSKEGKCMVACVLKHEGLMKDDKLDAEAVTAFITKILDNDEEKLKKAADMVAKCVTIDVEGLDKCERAAAYVECGKEYRVAHL